MIKDIEKRIYEVVPAGDIEMSKLLNLFSIKLSYDIPSACVTCSYRPELLINPDFIEEYCKTDEHLFMLLMHELYHVLLGHTKLFKNITMIDNIAFDAIINSFLCKEYKKIEYVSFFTNINSDETFPSAILRPIGKKTPSSLHNILDILYNNNSGTYYEIYEMLKSNLKQLNINDSFILIGNHSDQNYNNPLIKEVVEDIISKWPVEKTDFGLSQYSDSKHYYLTNPIKHEIKEFKRFLNKIMIEDNLCNQTDSNLTDVSIQSVILNNKDRTIYSKLEFLNEIVLYNDIYKENIKTIDSNKIVYIYLDVSGSVKDSLNIILPSLIKQIKQKRCKVFTFSTKVFEDDLKDLCNNKFTSTDGTNINCVFEHLFSLKQKIKKVLILTDGLVLYLNNIYKEKILKRNLKVYCGLFGKSTKEYMCDYVKEFKEFN